jgi:hypothetical protein
MNSPRAHIRGQQMIILQIVCATSASHWMYARQIITSNHPPDGQTSLLFVTFQTLHLANAMKIHKAAQLLMPARERKDENGGWRNKALAAALSFLYRLGCS